MDINLVLILVMGFISLAMLLAFCWSEKHRFRLKDKYRSLEAFLLKVQDENGKVKIKLNDTMLWNKKLIKRLDLLNYTNTNLQTEIQHLAVRPHVDKFFTQDPVKKLFDLGAVNHETDRANLAESQLKVIGSHVGWSHSGETRRDMYVRIPEMVEHAVNTNRELRDRLNAVCGIMECSFDELIPRIRVIRGSTLAGAMIRIQELEAAAKLLDKDTVSRPDLSHNPGEVQLEIRAWRETARQAEQGKMYYLGLIVEIAKYLGDDVYICDDGTLSKSILVAKIPELVAKALKEKKRVQS